MQRVESLPCDDREIGDYTRDVSRQRLGKRVPAAMNRDTTIEKLSGKECFYVSMPRSYKEYSWDDKVQFCTGVWEERT
jgi:hypothetical protein